MDEDTLSLLKFADCETKTVTTMRRNDKIMHAIAGMIIAGIIAGLVKEWCDMHTEGREWDWKDFGSTVIGAVIASLFILCLHYGRG